MKNISTIFLHWHRFHNEYCIGLELHSGSPSFEKFFWEPPPFFYCVLYSIVLLYVVWYTILWKMEKKCNFGEMQIFFLNLAKINIFLEEKFLMEHNGEKNNLTILVIALLSIFIILENFGDCSFEKSSNSRLFKT